MANFGYPLLLEPIPVPRPWGGGRLCKLYDRTCVESAQPIGESWDVSTWPKDPGNPDLATVTRIVNGPLAGTQLDRVVDVPVVVKLLDSAEKLSVQIHPVTEDVHKDEMWYVLHADPEAYLFCGLAPGITPAELCDVIKYGGSESEVLSKLYRADGIKPGMHFNVPTGTVHAVGPGIVAFEVSEKTQVTYRLYDYNRGRKLDVEEGCAAAVTVRPDKPALDLGLNVAEADEVAVLTEFPTFCVVKIAGSRLNVNSSRHMHLVTATMSDCAIIGPTPDWNIKLKQSFTCLVPPTSEPYEIDTGTGGEVLITPLKD